MRECTIKQTTRDSVEVVALDGALDAYSYRRLETVLKELNDANCRRVVLDCDGLTYVSSAALGVLIGFSRRVAEKGGGLILAGLSDKIMGIVKLLGFHKILRIADDVDGAIAVLVKEDPP